MHFEKNLSFQTHNRSYHLLRGEVFPKNFIIFLSWCTRPEMGRGIISLATHYFDNETFCLIHFLVGAKTYH